MMHAVKFAARKCREARAALERLVVAHVPDVDVDHKLDGTHSALLPL